MRVSCLKVATLRDTPADAEIISHQLLIRGGYIKRVTSGIYAYMPLMWRVLQKIRSIVEQEMDSNGALQMLLPQLHPSELWKKSGRWKGYTEGEGIMFHLKDRQGRELGLGPTHEEIITSISSEILNSYKQLPINLYQIQTKFRDEIRPRFGLMRSREFIMKDAYSFHSSEKCLKSTYEKMNLAYQSIFKRCGLETVVVEADSGAIGGAGSQEFMVTADAGEDIVLTTLDGKYSANQEKAISQPIPAIKLKEGKSSMIDTPDIKSIKDLCLKHELDSTQVIKVVLLLAILDNGKQQPLLISIRGDQDINEVKLINHLTKELNIGIVKLSTITKEKLSAQGLGSLPFGSIGPDLEDSLLKNAITWENKFLRLTDKTAAELDLFACGANQINKHRLFFNWALLGLSPQAIDFRKAKSGDQALHDPKQTLIERRGIEVGHIFQLGRKYSKSLDATFTNEKGTLEHFWMGCYGIGISRVAQAAVEQNHDELGIIWPTAIAPFEAIVIIANLQDLEQRSLGEKLYEDLMRKNIDVLLDDREARAGVKFKDADLIGIPWRIVVGREAKNKLVEVFRRGTDGSEVSTIDKAIKKVVEEIYAKKI